MIFPGNFIMLDIEIRPATREYTKQILEAHAQTYQEHHKRQPKQFPKVAETKKAERLIRSAFRTRFGSELVESKRLFVALEDRSFAGYILLGRDPAQRRFSWGGLVIMDIYVAPQYRSQEIGKRLLDHTKMAGKTVGWSELYALVWNGNVASEKLFLSSGFLPLRNFSASHYVIHRFELKSDSDGAPTRSTKRKPRWPLWKHIALGIVIVISIATFVIVLDWLR